MFAPPSDSLVKDISLYNKRHVAFHGYALPFMILYIIAGLVWNSLFGIEHYESGIMIFAAIFLTHVLTLLFCFWSVDVRCVLTCSKASNPQTAKFAKVSPQPNNGSKELQVIHRSKHGDRTKTWIEFQKVHYVFDEGEKKLFLPVNFPENEQFEYYQNSKGYQTDDDVKDALDTYGNNEMEMAIPEFMDLFQERATAPFFVFQVFCVGLWCLDEYWYYSIFTLFMLVAFEASLVYQQLRNMAEIRKMGNKPYRINVYRNRKWRSVLSTELVAGDVVSLGRSKSEDRLVPCDILLLRGRMIVDESMLTGESIPQMKEPIESVDKNTILDAGQHSRLHVISGGTQIVQHTPPPKNTVNAAVKDGLRPSDNGCLGYVLRTGFNTSQGKLLRTILFGVKRVTANNMETFAFILFLLIFAIGASAYVWVKGTEDPDRSRYKLMLNCTLILTSVVPPELPIELSLAVNSSLLALSKLHVFCTEPFRIPFAGKIDICCFDKTGTLTSDCLVVEGIAGIPSDKNEPGEKSAKLCGVLESPVDTQKVLATCHALVNMDEDLIGDPLEQTMLKSVEWNLTKADVVIPRKKIFGASPLKIVQRFHFSSLLKRMSVVASHEDNSTHEIMFIATVKGAAETLKPMFSELPTDYDKCHQKLSRRGARVLALGIKTIGKGLTHQQVRDLKREDVECNLKFAGFVIVSSPLKPDSKAIISEIKTASHYVTMITGDNPLTACYVAKVLKFTTKNDTLILSSDDGAGWSWHALHGKDTYALEEWNNELKKEHDLCVTGEGMTYLTENHSKLWLKVLPSVRVFARVKPKQKEEVITTLKHIGYTVLMCGDGTNDVGALKHADCGVALLSNAPKPQEKPATNETTPATSGAKSNKVAHRNNVEHDKGQPRTSARNKAQQRQEELERRKKKMQQMINEMEEPTIVKLGDASIASPFTYKMSSILAVCHIIKQGRCTLVTTLQMFKILAINALILAYSQSVLYLDGIKFGDAQATLQGLLLAACFLFISRSKPLKVLSSERPLPNIFNLYTILTVTLQFAVHFASLLFVVFETKKLRPSDDVPNIDADFEPNILNTTVYIISLAMQINTFAINYWGNPFMESLRENRALGYSLIGSFAFLVAILFGAMPEVNQQFQVVDIPQEFQFIMLQVLAVNFGATWFIDRLLRLLMGTGRIKKT